MKQLLFCFLIILSFQAYAQERTLWDYPVKPGTEAWKKLKDYEERVDVCQIPESVLQNISTNDLATLCLQYPLLYGGTLIYYNSYTFGLNKLFTNFNGIRELYKRKNAVNILQERYLTAIHGFPENVESSFFYLSVLELLLGYPDFSYISKENQKEVLKSLLFGYKEKCKYPEYFRGSGFTTNLYARAHLIIKIDTAAAEKFKGENQSVLYRGMAGVDLINTVDSLSYVLKKQ